MKIKSILFSMVAALSLAFTSCEQDNKGAIYNQDNQGASFLFNKVSTSAPASNPIVAIKVVRAKADTEASVNVTYKVLTEGVAGIKVAPVVNFAAGEKEANVGVDLGGQLEVGKKVDISITISDEDASIGGVKTVTLTAYKEYEWESLGKGYFSDGWLCGDDHMVEIMQAKGFPRYRVMDPYLECYTNGDPGIEVQMALRPKYIEFWELEDGVTIDWNGYSTAAIHPSYGVAMEYLRYYDFTGIESDKSMKIDDGIYQLAPYVYMDGIGGWNYTQKPLIYIGLPGCDW
ncbi:MAG: hypothetical protein MJZ69_00285 [Bacteroidaceae bacterium]|nr:hypothetical protein [Bacteroidaceae bacterium]